MKTTRYLALGAVAGVIAAFAWANYSNLGDAKAQELIQSPVVNQEEPGTERSQHPAKQHGMKASEIIGMNVRGESGDDNIGSINDLMIHNDGRVNYAVD